MPVNLNLTSNSPVSATSSTGLSDTVGSPRQDDFLKFDQIAIGKQLQGQIINRFKDGYAVIRIVNSLVAGSLLQIRLPTDFKIGDQLRLTLIANDNHQPRFAISIQTVDLGQIVISDTGQLLAKLIQENPATNPIASTVPLTTSETPDPNQLASQLNNAVDKSGVFYESHLKQWTEGERSVEQIRQEPQNINQANNSLIPIQLETLENNRFVWLGEAWPGQSIQWEVIKDQDSNKQTADESQYDANWKTTIKLDMPNLGQISATIKLQGESAQLQLHVNQADVASLLKNNSHKLAESFASSGIRLETLHTYDDGRA